MYSYRLQYDFPMASTMKIFGRNYRNAGHSGNCRKRIRTMYLLLQILTAKIDDCAKENYNGLVISPSPACPNNLNIPSSILNLTPTPATTEPAEVTSTANGKPATTVTVTKDGN